MCGSIPGIGEIKENSGPSLTLVTVCLFVIVT